MLVIELERPLVRAMTRFRSGIAAAGGGEGQASSSTSASAMTTTTTSRVSLPVPTDPRPVRGPLLQRRQQDVFTGDARLLTVSAIAVWLDAPDQVGQGATITIGWNGPGARYDEVQLWDPAGRTAARASKLFNKRIRNDDFDNRQGVPARAYRAGTTTNCATGTATARPFMATRPLEVMPIDIWLKRAVATVEVRRQGITVDWQGPGARYDEVQIVNPACRQGRVQRKRLRNDDFDNNRRAAVKAPGDTGAIRCCATGTATPGQSSPRYR